MISSGRTSKLAEFDTFVQTLTSSFEGLSNLISCYSTLPSSALSIGNLIIYESSATRFSSYQISPR